MKKFSFAIVGAVSLTLAACGGQSEDAIDENALENAGAQTEDLNALAANAAEQEAEALGNQSEQLNATENLAADPDEGDEAANEAEADAPVNGM